MSQGTISEVSKQSGDYLQEVLSRNSEFADLCKNSTADAVESALPFWPRNFNKLALVKSMIPFSFQSKK